MMGLPACAGPAPDKNSQNSEANTVSSVEYTEQTESVSGTEPSLRYDGWYCRILDQDDNGLIDNQIFRFYEDGHVICTSIEETEKGTGIYPKGDWFEKDAEDFVDYPSTWSLENGQLTFTIHSESGSVDYQGTVEGDTLDLNFYSHINGVRYRFQIACNIR